MAVSAASATPARVLRVFLDSSEQEQGKWPVCANYE